MLSWVLRVLRSIQDWLTLQRRSLLPWLGADKQESSPPEESLAHLPESTREQVLEQLVQLPSHPEQLKQLRDTFEQRFEAWNCEGGGKAEPKQEPVSSEFLSSEEQAQRWKVACEENVWIIVASSAANLSALMADLLATLSGSSDSEDVALGQDRASNPLTYQDIPVQVWSADARPLVGELAQLLEQKFGAVSVNGEGCDRRIAVIPCLEQCFLRSFDGLKSIDYLQKQLLTDSSTFWVIGIGEIGFQFLQATCDLEVYSNHTTHISPLSAEQLRDWLTPLVTKLDINFETDSLRDQISREPTDWEARYFKALEKESEGVDSIAIQLFLNSLRSSKDDGSYSCSYKRTASLKAVFPEHCHLPDVSSDALYILYSLLLHVQLDASELSESLGLPEHQLHRETQRLRKAGVIEQQTKALRINPVYCRSICSRLDGENFLV